MTQVATGPNACAGMEQDLVLYYYDELEREGKERITTHLDACNGCRSYVEHLGRILPLTVASDEPPEAFWQNYGREMHQKLSALPVSTGWWQKLQSFLQPWPVPAIATAAVLTLALALMLNQDVRRESEVPANDQALLEVLPVAENLDFFTNMDVLDAMDILQQMGSSGSGTS